MNLYSIALFVHIVGAISLFALLAVEGASFWAGFSARMVQQALGPVTLLLIVVPGFYMAAQIGWHGWVAVGLVSYAVIAVLGAGTGVGLMRGSMSVRAATLSWLARVGIALGVVFDMTLKPDVVLAAIAVLVAMAAGVAIGLVAARREVRTA